MRKFMCIILVVAVLLSMQMHTFAVATELSGASAAEYQLFENDKISMIVVPAENNETLVAWLEKTDHSVVYQWIGTLASRPEALFNKISNSVGDAQLLACSADVNDVDVFTINYREKDAENTTEATRTAAREQTTKNVMRGLYGAPRSWYTVFTSNDYDSLTIRVRADDTIEAEELGLVELPEGIYLAAEAISVAQYWGIPVPSALVILQQAVDIYDLLQVTYESYTLDSYRGVYMTQRTGTATPSGGTEIPLVTATYTRMKVVAFLTTNDYVVEEDTEEIYIPSDYKYMLSTIVDDTYEEYSYMR